MNKTFFFCQYLILLFFITFTFPATAQDESTSDQKDLLSHITQILDRKLNRRDAPIHYQKAYNEWLEMEKNIQPIMQPSTDLAMDEFLTLINTNLQKLPLMSHLSFTELKKSLGLTMEETSDGDMMVKGIDLSGPADQSGIKIGDRIISINGASPTQAALEHPTLTNARILLQKKGETTREYLNVPYQNKNEFQKGSFGWTLRKTKDEGLFLIKNVSPTGPAFKAGLREGDRVLAINGNKNLEEVFKQSLLTGQNVHLQIQKKDTQQVQELQLILVKRTEAFQPFYSEIQHGEQTGIYLSIPTFSDDYEPELVHQAFVQAQKYDFMFVDLRGNPGGRSDHFLSYLLPPGTEIMQEVGAPARSDEDLQRLLDYINSSIHSSFSKNIKQELKQNWKGQEFNVQYPASGRRGDYNRKLSFRNFLKEYRLDFQQTLNSLLDTIDRLFALSLDEKSQIKLYLDNEFSELDSLFASDSSCYSEFPEILKQLVSMSNQLNSPPLWDFPSYQDLCGQKKILTQPIYDHSLMDFKTFMILTEKYAQEQIGINNKIEMLENQLIQLNNDTCISKLAQWMESFQHKTKEFFSHWEREQKKRSSSPGKEGMGEENGELNRRIAKLPEKSTSWPGFSWSSKVKNPTLSFSGKVCFGIDSHTYCAAEVAALVPSEYLRREEKQKVKQKTTSRPLYPKDVAIIGKTSGGSAQGLATEIISIKGRNFVLSYPAYDVHSPVEDQKIEGTGVVATIKGRISATTIPAHLHPDIPILNSDIVPALEWARRIKVSTPGKLSKKALNNVKKARSSKHH